MPPYGGGMEIGMKITKLSAFLLCIPLLCVPLASCSDGNTGEKKIAVIVKAMDSDFWHGVKSGVDAAATEYNVSVTFEGPENEEDYENQNKMIEAAVNNGADAIVLSAIDYEKSAETVNEAVKSGARVITIDSGVDSKQVSMFIGTDNVAAGQKAGEVCVSNFSEGDEINIALINYYKSTKNGIQREDGFREYINNTPNASIITSVNVNSNTESVASAVTALLEDNSDINVIVGFNEWMTLGIGKAIKRLDLSDEIYAVGFDTNSVSVGMLETGEIDTLIVQNPFAIGYLGVKYAAETDKGKNTTEQALYTDAVAVNKENLFDEDIQKLVFRFN